MDDNDDVLAGRYRVARVVSEGANTVVVDAVDLQTERQVTVKVVRAEHAADDEFRRKFVRIAELSNALTHPNIASVLDWGDVDYEGEPTVFWTVEALGGGSLRDLLDRGRLLAPGQALVVGLEACRALDAAHQKGLFHTELTPSKMVFGADRRLRVVDFGMARLLGEGAWSDMASVPTHVARYASPEQALGLPVDAKTDVYALSLALVEAVTGSVPFAGESTQSTLAARIDKLLPVSADLGSLAAVLERAARPESPDRFTAAEFGRALVQAAGKLPKPEPIPILATGLFDTTSMRRPGDPTGPVERPEPVAAESGPASAPASDPVVDPGAAPEPESAVIESAVIEPGIDPGIDPVVDSIASASESAADLGPAPEQGAVLEPVAEPEPADAPVLAAGPHGTIQMPVAPAAAVFEDPDFIEPRDGTGEIYDDRPRRRRGPIVALVLLLIAGLGALGYAGSLLLQTKSFEIPELAGVQEGPARNQIEGNDWTILVERERSDEFPEPDTVIRTDPPAGIELDEGETITLVLSDGFEFRSLPDVTGMTVEAARAELEALLLSVGEVPDRVFSEDLAAGVVESWQVVGDATLREGAQILPGETILLTLSAGPEPRAVPDLAGATLDDATNTLAADQLGIVVGEEVFSEDVPVGNVVSQTPAAGGTIERDASVTVQVSKGPDVIELPSLDGLSYRDAEALLIDTGFRIGTLLGTTEGTFVQLTVGGEPVEPGTQFRRGQAVDVVFL